MNKKRSPISFEEKKQKVEALTKKMQQRIDQHFHSPEDLKEYLSFMAKFYRYSPSNVALIQSQFHGATAVGSFSFWKEKGFSVRKGEKGIVSGKKISANHVVKLLEKNMTDQIKGFESKQSGKKFDARLSYSTQEKRVKFLFGK